MFSICARREISSSLVKLSWSPKLILHFCFQILLYLPRSTIDWSSWLQRSVLWAYAQFALSWRGRGHIRLKIIRSSSLQRCHSFFISQGAHPQRIRFFCKWLYHNGIRHSLGMSHRRTLKKVRISEGNFHGRAVIRQGKFARSRSTRKEIFSESIDRQRQSIVWFAFCIEFGSHTLGIGRDPEK